MPGSTPGPCARRLLIALVGLGLCALPAGAQQAGAIAGTVTSATNQPISGAQIVVEGTGLGTISDADGAYRIGDVPAGSHTLAVRHVGYGNEETTVEVTAGQVVTADFRLSRSAIELNELVVTGTGTEGMERRRLGNTVASISTEELQDAPTTSFSEVLAAREPGVNVLPSSGIAGEGSPIRIRGSASLSQSNEAIVYLDGIRINSGGGFAGPVGGGGQGTGATSRLDDIDPSAIERIEVLKGAAAATLYGTEASNGVIQIFTKAGREGDTRWNFEMEQGLEFMPTNRDIPFADFAGPGTRFARGSTEQQLETLRNFWGFQGVEPYEVVARDVFPQAAETGRNTTASGWVSGGGSSLTYFVSGRYQNVDGIFGLEDLGPARDQTERWMGTANINLFPTEKLGVRVRSNYANTDQQSLTNGNSPFGPQTMLATVMLTVANERNPFGIPVFATVRETMQQTLEQQVDHFSGSVSGNYLPSSDIAVNATLGIDFSSNDSEEMLPFGWNVDEFATANTDGSRAVGSELHTELTTELRAGWDEQLGDEVTSTLTVGGQGFLVENRVKGSTGFDFPGPGLEVTGAASNQQAVEIYSRNVNIGIFAQEQLGWRDFAFLTVGGRWDTNSAFGETFGGQFYPKASFSVIPSDLPSWESDLVSTLRLRGAWGRSGLQPGAFDQFRTFTSLPTTEGPGVRPDNLGNPDIAPEVSTEFEAGLEAGLFEDRAAVEATVWDRTVNDVLVAKQFPVSGGFADLQLANIGQLEAHGVDLTLRGRVLDREDVSMEVFANGAYLSEMVTDMGGAPPIKTGGSYPRNRNFIQEGLPPGAFLGAEPADVPIPLDLTNDCTEPSREDALAYFSQPRSPDEFMPLAKGCGTADMQLQYLGKPTPDWSGSFGTRITMFDRLKLYSLWEYRAGNFQVQDLTSAFRQASAAIGRNTPLAAQVESTLLNPASSAEERLDAAITYAQELEALDPFTGMNTIWDADYVRWRELSLTYDVPSSAARALSMRTLSVSFRVRNLALSVNDDYKGLSPELNANARCDSGNVDCNFLMGQEVARLPIPRRFSLAVRAGF